MNIIEEINDWYIFISTALMGVGGLISWFGLRTYEKTRNKARISENKKDIKVNSIAGDEAILTQLNDLLNRIALMSGHIHEMQVELNELKEKEIAYKSAFKRLLIACSEICDQSELCKERINNVLEDLNINIDNEIDNTK